MFVTVSDLLEKLQKVNIDREIKIAIGKTSKQMADLNREHLAEGFQSTGRPMPNYSFTSVNVFGKPAGPIRLYETGAFHKTIQVDVGSDTLQFLAVDKYKLFKRYGKNEILGLTDRSKEYYNEEIFYPQFKEQIENQTGLKFE